MKLIKKIMNLLKYNPNLKIHGNNNHVETKYYKKVSVKIYGNNNTVIIKDTNMPVACTIIIGCWDCRVDNCTVEIGENLYTNGFNLFVMEDNTKVSIGNDCMISNSVMFYASDTHSILNENGQLTNCGKYIDIGNHVWIGYNATICKNITIADNCIVGTGSVVTKSCDKSNSIIAGNPAKIVKENINWDKKRPKQYLVDCQEHL